MEVRLNRTYTLLDTRFDTEFRTENYKYALTNARLLVHGSTLVNVGAITFGVQGLWKERLRGKGLATDKYGVTHTRLAYRTRLAGGRTTVSAELRNVFYREYSVTFNAPMPDRTVLAGAKVGL